MPTCDLMFTRVEEWVEEQQGRLEERLEEASQEEEQEKVKERIGEIKGAAGFVDCHDLLFFIHGYLPRSCCCTAK